MAQNTRKKRAEKVSALHAFSVWGSGVPDPQKSVETYMFGYSLVFWTLTLCAFGVHLEAHGT